jgi:two-component system sensor histidine kinase QseC
MSRSIQSRLTFTLTIAAISLSALIGALLYHVIGAEMTRNFDRALEAKGKAIVSLVSLEPKDPPQPEPITDIGIPTTRMSVAGGALDFEFNSGTMPEYQPGPKAEYFQIRFADGRPFSSAKSLGNTNLRFDSSSTKRNESFFDQKLPDGRSGRAVQIAFVPESDQPSPVPAEPMVAVIARRREELDENLEHLLQSLAGAAVLLGLATALTSMWIVRRSLRPLRRVAEHAASIDVTKLDARLSPGGLPAELVPICEKLNDLLGRLDASFTRERRFTTDVAHELRTPIAELRSIAEVALKWPSDNRSVRDALSESLVIAIQMQTLVNTLLSLVRTNQNRIQISPKPIELGLFVGQIVSNLISASQAHQVEVSIPSNIVISAEPTLLGSVLTNLLINASEYSQDGSPVRCTAREEAGKAVLVVENHVKNLSQDDLPHLFEPFWRKDPSRTNNLHAGLGLSLVRAYCDLMEIEISATLRQSKLSVQLVSSHLISNSQGATQPARL